MPTLEISLGVLGFIISRSTKKTSSILGGGSSETTTFSCGITRTSAQQRTKAELWRKKQMMEGKPTYVKWAEFDSREGKVSVIFYGLENWGLKGTRNLSQVTQKLMKPVAFQPIWHLITPLLFSNSFCNQLFSKCCCLLQSNKYNTYF